MKIRDQLTKEQEKHILIDFVAWSGGWLPHELAWFKKDTDFDSPQACMTYVRYAAPGNLPKAKVRAYLRKLHEDEAPPALEAANEDNVRPKRPRIVTWKLAMQWLAALPMCKSMPLKGRRGLLLDFYAFWSTDGLQDSKAWELRQDIADMLRKGVKVVTPRDFEAECRDRLKGDKHVTDPEDLFDLRGELEDFFL